MDAEHFELELGAAVRALRVSKNITRERLAADANVSLGAVKNLENGYGARVATLVAVVHALGRSDWLTALTPPEEFDPFAVLEVAKRRAQAKRSRARSR